MTVLVDRHQPRADAATVRRALQGMGRVVPASHLSRMLQLPLDRTYAALVHLEARGLARIVVNHRPTETKGWESMG